MSRRSPEEDPSDWFEERPFSTSRSGKAPCSLERAKSSPPVSSSPPPVPTAPQDPLVILTQQVQTLVGMVQRLQEHHSEAARQRPGPPLLSRSATPASRQSTRRRSPPTRPLRSHSPGGPLLQDSQGGSRSFSRSSGGPPGGRRRGKEPGGERGRWHHQSLSYSPGPARGQTADQMGKRLDEQDRRLEELSQRINNQPGGDYETRPPLTRRIMEEPIPRRFRFPQLDPYDGTTDPLDHLESYKAIMQVQGATDALLCVAFPATLRKAARAWYSRLPPRGIDSFRQLEGSFLTHFDACRKIPRVADSLFSVQQQEGESLKDFIIRFKVAALEVYHLDDAVATLALKRGLRPSRFTYSLDKRPPCSYADLLNRAQKYIRADEADSSRRSVERRLGKRPSRPESSGPPSKKPEPSRRPSDRRRSLAPRENHLTPLLVPRAHILMEIENEPYLRRPPPLKKGATRDRSRYCRFHRDYGHDTEECRNLKQAIEELIRRGYLGQYVQKKEAPPVPALMGPPPALMGPPPAQANIDNTPTERMVGMISCGGAPPSKKPRESGELDDVIPFKGDLAGSSVVKDDSVVVSMTIAKHPVKRILIDSGSSANVLTYDAFLRMNLSTNSLRPVAIPLVGFTGDSVQVEGEITLPATAGSPPCQSTMMMEFLVVRVPLAYNAILGRPGLNMLDAVISTKRLLVQFPTGQGVGEMRGEVCLVRPCYHLAPSPQVVETPSAAESFDPRDAERRGEPAERLVSCALGGDPAKAVQIGEFLPSEAQSQLLAFLLANADVFAWQVTDMVGIPPEVITHQLNIDPRCRPVRQKKRSFAPERQKVIDEEVDKLLRAGHIREAQYPDWLANVVMVRKASGGWRICIDYTDLNKACPKDSFPLPRIDQLVDSTSGYELLSFMDAFSGYNQIKMSPSDEEHTSFITEKGVYCYKVMPFGLKNAGATYQRLMNKVFKDQLGRNMEVYVDDMLTKSTCAAHHVADLRETFHNLRLHRIKLNPRKCAFGVTAGKFLGFLVTRRGIEANPEKIRAILDMRRPACKKEVQQLTGRIAALSRFLSKSAERCLPFFKVLRKADGFEWTEGCQRAFEELKEFLSTPPLLSKPEEGEKLFLYLATSSEAVSSVLVRVGDHAIQKPVYYTSKVLHGAEERYSRTEKIIFALVISARRLRPYFQAHPIVVLTDQPLRALLSRPDTSGRLAKWAVKLGEFDLSFQPRAALKSQVLADFLVECTWTEERCEGPPRPSPDVNEESGETWVLQVDGASNSQGSGAGLVLIGPEGVMLEYALRFLFEATNNQAEYEALLAGIKLAHGMGVRRLRAFTDSQLISAQVSGEYEARDPVMSQYLSKVKLLIPLLDYFTISYIPRGENVRADILARLATSAEGAIGRTYVEHLETPSIEATEEALQVAQGETWRDAYIRYLRDGILPVDGEEARLLKRRASKFVLLGDQLYRRSFSQPLLKCLNLADADYVLREIHEGICGNHQGGRSLARKALRQGYYWLTMQADATELVKRCDQCQRHANVQRQPASQLNPLFAPWPFAKWGMDILGPFPPAAGQRKFLLVAVDYFTKWVEVEALARITEAKVRTFFWKSIICRFGLPHTLVTDNGRQFDNSTFRTFCADLGIKHRFASVGHPQSNGEAEVTNRMILRGLRTRLDTSKGRWVEELPSILWAYHTTPRVPTGETPFSLVFGSEAVVPVEVGLPSARVESYDEAGNLSSLRASLDLIDEARDRAQIKMAAYQQQVARYYNTRVRPRHFRRGDLVLRRASVSKPTEGGKLSPNWEGPYRIAEVLHRGAYRLEDLSGQPIPRTWNADNLRQYYQ